MSKDSKINKLLTKLIVDSMDMQQLCDELKNRFTYFDEFDDLDKLMGEIIKIEKDMRLSLNKLKKEI